MKNKLNFQVSSRKYEILTRASSVGVEDRENLNPDLMRQVSHSARASPVPVMKQIMSSSDTVDVQQKSVQVTIIITDNDFTDHILTKMNVCRLSQPPGSRPTLPSPQQP